MKDRRNGGYLPLSFLCRRRFPCKVPERSQALPGGITAAASTAEANGRAHFPASLRQRRGWGPTKGGVTSHPARVAPWRGRDSRAEGRGQQSARFERGRSRIIDAASHPRDLEPVWQRCGAVGFSAAWKLVVVTGCGRASVKKVQEVGSFG